MRVITGYVTFSEQLLQQALDDEAAIAEHQRRMETDPEYAAEWLRGQAEREDDWDD